MSNTTTKKKASAPEAEGFVNFESTAKVAETVTGLFQDALRNYEKSVKAGIELQEESLAIVKDIVAKFGTPEEFKAQVDAYVADAVPSARAKFEEGIEAFSKSSAQAFDLIEKTAEIGKAKSVTEAQAKVQNLVETSIAIQRDYFKTFVNANAKVVDAWKDVAAKFVPVAA